MYHIWQLQFQWQLVPTFVPSTEFNASVDPSSIPLPKANFTKLWSGGAVLVLEIWFSRETIFTIQPMFNLRGEVVM